jgi:hypothetical protein
MQTMAYEYWITDIYYKKEQPQLVVVMYSCATNYYAKDARRNLQQELAWQKNIRKGSTLN